MDIFSLQRAARALFLPSFILSSIYQKKTSRQDHLVWGYHTERFRHFRAVRHGNGYIILDFNQIDKKERSPNNNVSGILGFADVVQKIILLEQELVAREWCEVVSSSRRGKNGVARLVKHYGILSPKLNPKSLCYDKAVPIHVECAEQKRQKILLAGSFRRASALAVDGVISSESPERGIKGFKPFVIVDNTMEPR